MAENTLLQQVRNYLDITWEDPGLDEKLTGMIERGKAYIRAWGGKDLDFEADGTPKALLLDYCRYVRSNALDEFRVNYAKDLRELQWDKAEADVTAPEEGGGGE